MEEAEYALSESTPGVVSGAKIIAIVVAVFAAVIVAGCALALWATSEYLRWLAR